MFTVYVLFNEKFLKIYIGYSSAFEIRLLSHNHLGTKGFARRYRPWIVLHVENYINKTDAIFREKQLKSGSRKSLDLESDSEKFPDPLDSYPPYCGRGFNSPLRYSSSPLCAMYFGILISSK
jgi:putative endonuclease